MTKILDASESCFPDWFFLQIFLSVQNGDMP